MMHHQKTYVDEIMEWVFEEYEAEGDSENDDGSDVEYY
jgi:hypothetical protein